MAWRPVIGDGRGRIGSPNCGASPRIDAGGGWRELLRPDQANLWTATTARVLTGNRTHCKYYLDMM